MSNPTMERLIDLKRSNIDRIKLIVEKALDELNLMINNKNLKKD